MAQRTFRRSCRVYTKWDDMKTDEEEKEDIQKIDEGEEKE